MESTNQYINTSQLGKNPFTYLPHSCKIYLSMPSSSSKLLASHIDSPKMYSGSFLNLFSRAAGSWPWVLPAPVDSLLLTSCKAFRRCSTFLSAFCNSSVRASPLPDLCKHINTFQNTSPNKIHTK